MRDCRNSRAVARPRPLRLLDELQLSEEDSQKLFHDNAIRILGLS